MFLKFKDWGNNCKCHLVLKLGFIVMEYDIIHWHNKAPIMIQRQLAEIIAYFMIVVLSCLSRIISFIALDEYNLILPSKWNLWERVNYILMGVIWTCVISMVIMVAGWSLGYAHLFVCNFPTRSLINIYVCQILF